MILKSFDAFIKVVHNEFTPEELIGVVTKERINQIISDIREGKAVSEEFCLNGLDKEEKREGWYGLRIEWSEEERTGVLVADYKGGTDWYEFNFGSLHLSRLYNLVPDLEKSDEVELKAEEEREILDNLMKWEHEKENT